MHNAHMSDAFDALLAPLARLFLARGVGYSDLAERLKGHYVKAAMAQDEVKPTDSRLSVITGLSRREVARLRAFEVRAPKPNPLTRIVALWQTDTDYCDANGPLDLPRTGPAPSFETLARLVLQDVHPRTLLDSLMAAGTVEATNTEQVRLTQTAYVPATGSDEQLAYLAENVGDHLTAATENVGTPSPLHFERALHVEGLSQHQVDTLAAKHSVGQMALLQDLQQEAEAMKRAGEGTKRIRIGAYFFRTDRTP